MDSDAIQETHLFRVRQTRNGRWVGESYNPTSSCGRPWAALSGGVDAEDARQQVLEHFVRRRNKRVRFEGETKVYTRADLTER